MCQKFIVSALFFDLPILKHKNVVGIFTVERRWAIITTVFPCISVSKPFCIWCSFSGSANAVASSRTIIGASFKMALANAIRCCSPPDKYTPFVPMTVCKPSGILSIMSWHIAALIAVSTCSDVAFGFAARIFSRVYLRSQKCWNIRQKAPDARRMSAALLGGMQANATQQMGLFGRIEQRWGVFRYTLSFCLTDLPGSACRPGGLFLPGAQKKTAAQAINSCAAARMVAR